MTDTVRLWLVERSIDQRDVLTLVYATPEGDRKLEKQLSVRVMHMQNTDTTAAVEVDDAELDAVDDEATRDRYAEEARRMRDRHDPDEEV